MQGIKYKAGTERSRRIIKTVLALICLAVLVFFLIRYISMSRADEDAELLLLVSALSPLEEEYTPRLDEVEGVQVAESCAEALRQMLAAAEQAGCQPVLIEGYLSRQAQQENYEANLRTAAVPSDVSLPGTDEHELGLTVDIVDNAYQTKDIALTGSDTYRWLSDHCWEYGFVIRYPEDKTEVTGRSFMPWHYRYVGLESAQLMKELQLCLEEYYTWFYSDDVIVIY